MNSQQIERIKQIFIAEYQLNHINQLGGKFRKAPNEIRRKIKKGISKE